MKPSIELHIEELVLHGFAPRDRYRIAEALQRELVLRLAQENALQRLARDGAFQSLDAGAVHINAGARPETMGARMGEAIHAVLSEPALLSGDRGGARPFPVAAVGVSPVCA
ncbi:MAG: hypothetical protein L0Z50_29490 [Verrucomicrobiales bacterium]|nr:hypothetical protein [Verrucomicrobiales bacterium]